MKSRIGGLASVLHLECSQRVLIIVSMTFPQAKATIAHVLFTPCHYAKHHGLVTHAVQAPPLLKLRTCCCERTKFYGNIASGSM